MITARSLRLLRGWTAAVVATGAAALAHTAAGGPWPSPLLVALCLALSAPVCMLLAGLRLPGLGLTLSVAVSQLLFHGLFSVSGSMSAAVDHTSHAGHLGAASDGPELVLSATGAMVHDHAALEALGVSSSSASWLMPVLHAAAGIVTVLVLRHGEKLALRAAATLLIRARALISRIGDPVVIAASAWRCAPMGPAVPRLAQVILAALRYRGPPVRMLAI